jgi:hypothetical protein
MTDALLPAGRFVEGPFGVGHVLGRARSVFSRNFLKFTMVTAVTNLPGLLLQEAAGPINPLQYGWFGTLGYFLMGVLFLLSQAILLYAAFQVMNEKPAKLAESVRVGLRRLFPVLGLAVTAVLAVAAYLVGVLASWGGLGRLGLPPVWVGLGVIASALPAVAFYLMWSVAVPVCVVEKLGPLRSLGRSRALTKGRRVKILGLTLLVLLPTAVVGGLIAVALVSLGSGAALGLGAPLAGILGRIISLSWNAIWVAFYAVLAVVTYHDLRVAKEGVSTEQIAAVFE